MIQKYFILLIVTISFAACSDKDVCEGIFCQEGFIPVELNGSCECQSNTNNETNIIIKTGVINSDETWSSENIYNISGKVVVMPGSTLTIEEGTIIKGSEGTGSLASALIISRGSKINACGTSEAPIIFTSILDNIEVGQTSGSNLDSSQNGLWGGLIILGNAPGSFEGDVDEFQIEGIPADDTFGLYGGNDPADNSGTICYLSIRHGGASIGENNEINGITFGGVGSQTQVSNIEVVANLDDGIEFFGGTVNLNNAIVWAQGDDAFDFDQGYAGSINNIVYIAGPDSDHGLEVDGPEGSSSGSFRLTGGTFKGLNSEIADFREGATCIINNCSFFNFPADGDLEIDDNQSSENFFNDALNLAQLEFVSTLSLEEICHDKSENADELAFDEKMKLQNQTASVISKGANTSDFEWTYSFKSGALNF